MVQERVRAWYKTHDVSDLYSAASRAHEARSQKLKPRRIPGDCPTGPPGSAELDVWRFAQPWLGGPGGGARAPALSELVPRSQRVVLPTKLQRQLDGTAIVGRA